MGFKRVIQGGKDFLKPKKWEEWTKGDYIEGEYVNASELDRYGKPIYEIRVTDKKLTGSDPTILTGDRKGIIPLYPNGGLMKQMEHASYGDKVRITYDGMNEIKKGKWKGEMAHAVILEIDGYEEENLETDAAGDDLLG